MSTPIERKNGLLASVLIANQKLRSSYLANLGIVVIIKNIKDACVCLYVNIGVFGMSAILDCAFFVNLEQTK